MTERMAEWKRGRILPQAVNIRFILSTWTVDYRRNTVGDVEWKALYVFGIRIDAWRVQ